MTAPQPVQDVLDLPRVTGRHRNRPLASRRRSAALKLVSEGMTYQQVADHLGYRSRGTVHRLVRTAIQALDESAVQDYRQQAAERLERLLSAVWALALAGDLRAARTALRIVDAECRLMGLYEKQGRSAADGWPCCQGAPTLVTRQDDCRWAGCDRHGRFDT